MTKAALELAKLLLSGYFSFARMQGASEEEVDALYTTAKDEFIKNTPDSLDAF